MSRHALALICMLGTAMSQPSGALAGVWGVDPVIGVVGDYSTNAELLDVPHTAQSDGALLLSAPVTYNGGAFALFVTPSFRLSNSTGYSSVTSDYDHLDVKGEYDTALSVLTATAGVSRDSSLYYDYLYDGSTGVRRDAWTADLNWDRFLTERVDFATDVNSTEVRYGATVGIPILTDYRYTSIAPSVSWISGERGKLTFAASVGRYNSLDGTTESRNANLRIGFVGQLTEIWSLTAIGGYSRALNHLDAQQEFVVLTPNGPAIETVPVALESSQNGAIYSVNLSRKGTLVSINAAASRQLMPSGFAYLTLQNVFELSVNYTYSDRWSYSADARYVRLESPQLQGELIEQTPKYLGVTANWRWTERWTVIATASRIIERVQPPNINLASSEVSITLSRKFDHIKFQ
jgi:hypothetical protein